MRRASEILCVFEIQLKSMRSEIGPFFLAALVFPAGTYLFATAVTRSAGGEQTQLRFLAGSIVFSLSLTSISWLGYLLLENRFTGRLKLLATLPLPSSSDIGGFLVFAIVQATLATTALLFVGRIIGVPMQPSLLPLSVVVLITVLCLSGLGAVIAATARSFTEGSLLTDAFGAGLVFLAPVFYPPQSHGWRVLSQLLPTTLAAHGVQTTLAGSYAITRDVFALGVMTVVALTLGFRLTKWRQN